MHKQNAEMAFLAREMCDSLFKIPLRSLVLIDPKSQACLEWWLDPRGRYESADVTCAFSETKKNRWSLACQYKDRGASFTLVHTEQNGDRFVPTEPVIGIDPGPLFASMAACIQHRATTANR